MADGGSNNNFNYCRLFVRLIVVPFSSLSALFDFYRAFLLVYFNHPLSLSAPTASLSTLWFRKVFNVHCVSVVILSHGRIKCPICFSKYLAVVNYFTVLSGESLVLFLFYQSQWCTLVHRIVFNYWSFANWILSRSQLLAHQFSSQWFNFSQS